MTDSIFHPTPDRLEAFTEGGLPDGERVVIESHLVHCQRCQSEVEEWRALFAVLAELPTFSPSPGFAKRVMAGVALPRPWYVRASQFIGGLLPRTTRGWVFASGVVSLPGIVIAGLVTWLLTQVSWSGLSFAAVRERAVGMAVGGADWVLQSVLKTDVALWVGNATQKLLAAAGSGQLGAAAALFAVLTAVSLWVLYRNLMKNPSRENPYASFSF